MKESTPSPTKVFEYFVKTGDYYRFRITAENEQAANEKAHQLFHGFPDAADFEALDGGDLALFDSNWTELDHIA